MMQWWNNATIRAFRERAQCIIDQYSRYKIDEVGLFMNGRMTQGENIADNGGLKQAFRVSYYFEENIGNIYTNILCPTGVPKMGFHTWRRTGSSGFKFNSQSIIFSELCSDLVWINASRRRTYQNKIVSTFTGICSRFGTIIEFKRLC